MAAPMSRILHTCRLLLFTKNLSLLTRRNLSISSLTARGNHEEGQRVEDDEKSDAKETHFGFEQVSEEEKAEKVFDVFKNVADKYDVMNDAMSLAIHRLWKDRFMQVLAPPPGTRLLDVAGGTGDIAFRFLDYTSREAKNSDLPEPSHVTVCDINPSMLKVGEERAKARGIHSGLAWMEGNAEELPINTESVDAYTIAFGIRNVTHIEKVLEEAYRVLVPGGRFLCLEFSHVQNPMLKSLYDNYSFQVIPVIGQVIAGDYKSYQYLVESIRQFPDQERFATMMRNAGFSMVTYENLSLGIAAIHSGFKMDSLWMGSG
ncbi:ubiquinone/menaquinone biosynthesis C-methyltransferase UbiE-like [Amphiura filiformis]|uniref:ubiquinone/menaquinone biosynthesis C-methyltransferase UbiE-like n=1 Tax=Amphiura filiformis TaxID=82378 RepID=UPI003B216203